MNEHEKAQRCHAQLVEELQSLPSLIQTCGASGNTVKTRELKQRLSDMPLIMLSAEEDVLRAKLDKMQAEQAGLAEQERAAKKTMDSLHVEHAALAKKVTQSEDVYRNLWRRTASLSVRAGGVKDEIAMLRQRRSRLLAGDAAPKRISLMSPEAWDTSDMLKRPAMVPDAAHLPAHPSMSETEAAVRGAIRERASRDVLEMFTQAN
jgi:hypothetical protein